jgi:hypothetical protein
MAYCKARAEVKRVIAKAKTIERLNLGEMLEKEDVKGGLFRIVKHCCR